MKMFKLSCVVLSIAALTACGSDGDTGTEGAKGVAGTNSLVIQTKLAINNQHCPNGGIQMDSGLDADSDKKLSAAEISATNSICNAGRTQLNAGEVLTNTNNPWYQQASSQMATDAMARAKIKTAAGSAKNIILFVGDGMGVSTVTAARILEGQRLGKTGEENSLSFDKFPFAGLAKTYNTDGQTPDSAGTMTAIVTGVKSDKGVLSVDENVERGECKTVKGSELITALELAEIAGMSTGVISTARITHATPAATFAKSADRNWEDDSDMPAEAIAAGCEDIASQLINFEANLEARYPGLDVDGIEVAMGGGRRHFLPKDPAFNSNDAVSSTEGDRKDGRQLISEWQVKYPTGSYVMDQSGFDAINPATTERIFGLFNESHMHYEADRKKDGAGEPSLTEMIAKAIDVLDNNDKGFFLSVESGRIDHAHHAGNAYNALNDTIEFAKAVQYAVDHTNPEETLIIVTADHSHVFTIAGYPKRGNPILGKVVKIGKTEAATDKNGLPYTTVGYTNGRGFQDLGNETDADVGYDHEINAGRHDLTHVDTTAPGFHQESLVPRSSETHAGEDVGIYAIGPGAHLITGTNEQSIIFHAMDYAANLVKKANDALK